MTYLNNFKLIGRVRTVDLKHGDIVLSDTTTQNLVFYQILEVLGDWFSKEHRQYKKFLVQEVSSVSGQAIQEFPKNFYAPVISVDPEVYVSYLLFEYKPN